MHSTKTELLIVDDEPAIRKSMSLVLQQSGYVVRSAENGFSALAEINKLIPDILLSDLNMPGMSGYELLPVVRRRFPVIRVIAMSGAFSGNEVPLGVVADAFYQKGSAPGDLLKMMTSLPQPDRITRKPNAAPAPVWVSRYERNADGGDFALIECSECLGTFPKFLSGEINPANETDCIYCGTSVRYAIFQPDELPFLLPFQDERSYRTRATESMRELNP
jgi:CheY-like chemotaxis protein